MPMHFYVIYRMQRSKTCIKLKTGLLIKLDLRKTKWDSSSAALKELQWLPIKLRPEFKAAWCTNVHKLWCSHVPQYLKNLVRLRTNTRTLHSNTKINFVPKVNRNSYGGVSFSFMGPTLWNNLPTDIQKTDDFATFKKTIEIFSYFNEAFGQ